MVKHAKKTKKPATENQKKESHRKLDKELDKELKDSFPASDSSAKY